jgi:hypothetical protein
MGGASALATGDRPLTAYLRQLPATWALCLPDWPGFGGRWRLSCLWRCDPGRFCGSCAVDLASSICPPCAATAPSGSRPRCGSPVFSNATL